MNNANYFDPDNFAEKAMAADTPIPQAPRVFYDENCDSLQLIFREADYKAQPLDSRLTILVERADPPHAPQIVGIVVSRVREFIHEFVDENPGFQQECQDGDITFEALAKAIQWSSDNAEVQEVLHRLGQKVGDEITIRIGRLLCDA
jgi:hypothetical protein